MRRNSLALLALAVLALLAASPRASAQESQPGDACSTANHTRWAGGIETGGKGYYMTCQGGVWVRITESDTGGNLGVKQAAPKAPLHVGGEAIIGATTGLACDADRTGGIRWSSANLTLEMCDGTAWQRIAATVGGSDFTPDAFSFTDLTGQPLSQVIVSNTLTITGMAAGTVASVTGAGTPEISINGGSWTTSGIINPGATLQVRLTTSNAVSTARVAAVTVGTVTDNWSVTTLAGNTQIFRTANTYNGNLGGIGGAHTICQAEAVALGYSGIWRALLSNSFVDAKDLVSITYPVVRASDGVTVDATNLWDGSISNPVTNNGNKLFTGSTSAGTNYNNLNCSNWRSTSGQPAVTNNPTLTSDAWIYCAAGHCWDSICSASHGFYCVNQAAPLGAKLGISGITTPLSVYGTGSPAYGATRTLTVENAGDTTSATISTSLSSTTNYEIVSDTCNGTTLAQGAACTLGVRAKATFPGESSGAISATLNVTANNNPSFALSGYKYPGKTGLFKSTSQVTGNPGGLAGADATCQADAVTLGYAGIWKALLSTSTVDAKDRLTITYPVLRASDNVIIDSVNLWDGSTQNPPATTATWYDTWTGTNSDGTKGANTCSNWSSASSGTSGIAAQPTLSNSGWLVIAAETCNLAKYLYCVEQPNGGTVVLNFSPSSATGMNVTGPGTPAYGTTVNFTLQNTGTGTSGVLSTSLTNVANFQITSDACAGNTLAPAATCVIGVRPMASADGTYGGSLTITHSAGSVAAGMSGTSTGFGSAVVGYWKGGIDSGDIYYSSGDAGIGLNNPKAPLHVGGEAIIGQTTGLACDADRTGGIRWSSTGTTFEMCDGSAWKRLIATSDTGATSTPNSGTGYFVVSNGAWSGDLRVGGTGMDGANARCLSDLQTNNWLNKNDAASRGMLNASHVEAWLCSGTVDLCQKPLANTTYTFAASGSATNGGATFTASSSGLLPNNTQNWSGSNYFGSGVSYWTNRGAGSASLDGGNSHNYTGSSACGSWTSTNSSWWGFGGSSNASDSVRWNNGINVTCDQTRKLVCMVHPGNETPTTNGYFVRTSTTWNGNLGGQSGAHAKCLTELTTNTNWLGYATANANGQLTGSKVFAFGQCGTNGGACTGNVLPNTTYNFAVVGDAAKGGASFTADGTGYAPVDTANWGGTAYFGTSASYWSSRYSTVSNVWLTIGWASNCSDWTSSSSGVNGGVGLPANTSDARWRGEVNPTSTCDQSLPLVCIVNP